MASAFAIKSTAPCHMLEFKHTIDALARRGPTILKSSYSLAGFCINPVLNKVISGFQALRQARMLVACPESATDDPCRSQGGFAIHCANLPTI
ncbi:hypothetical protein PoB_000771100 [Plakobranchus ocellatus]|uniref:Uncharacterized protein n=1 Tax=Plakobranchus ocellatus TaxID=259542 RepID=A0AAV3YFP3_9GAST|nr:hypothetical protein PoB_000771100 [Plakobranchus ocellatus]